MWIPRSSDLTCENQLCASMLVVLAWEEMKVLQAVWELISKPLFVLIIFFLIIGIEETRFGVKFLLQNAQQFWWNIVSWGDKVAASHIPLIVEERLPICAGAHARGL